MLTDELVSTAGSSLGTGGMSTKIVAARLATSSGVTTVITRSSSPGNILKIVRHVQASRSPASLATTTTATEKSHYPDDHGDDPLSQSTNSLHLDLTNPAPLHTRFLPSPHPIRDRSFWILHGLKPHGTIYIDAGAHRALVGKAGLLPAGVVDVEGSFAQQEAVRLCVVSRRSTTTTTSSAAAAHGDGGIEDISGGGNGRGWDGPAVEVGRAIVNYAATEIARIKGHQSTEIEGLLGYADSDYVAPREHICFFRMDSRPGTPVRDVLDSLGIGGYESGAGSVL